MAWWDFLSDIFGNLGMGGGTPEAPSAPSWGEVGKVASAVFDPLANIAKEVAPIAKTAATGLNIAGTVEAMRHGGQQAKAAREMQEQERALAAPATRLAEAVLPAGQQALLGGKLPPGLEAEATNWEEQARQRIRQYLSQAGITDSTMAAQFESWIAQQGALLRQQLAEGLVGQGLAATTAAAGPLTAAERSAAGRAASSADLLKQANAALAQLLGRE